MAACKQHFYFPRLVDLIDCHPWTSLDKAHKPPSCSSYVMIPLLQPRTSVTCKDLSKITKPRPVLHLSQGRVTVDVSSEAV